MQRINEASESAIKFLEGIPLSATTVKTYRSNYRIIYAYCESNRISRFGDREAELYINAQKYRREKREISQGYYQYLRRAAALLADQTEGRTLEWKHKNYRPAELNECFDIALVEFGEQLMQTLSVGTCRVSVSIARQFLIFLKNGGVDDFKALTADDIGRFMSNAAPRYTGSMQKLVGVMMRFISFLSDTGRFALNVGRYLAKPASPRVRLLPCFNDKEADSILNAVDLSTVLGKRDFAIMKLALGTGLRGVDIYGLRMLDIDWRKKEINIVQSKTNTYIQLPLSNDVGNAIADYILNARPKSDCPYIFLRSKRPYDRFMSLGAGRGIIKRYSSKAGVTHVARDGKTFHAFRRTVGTRLVKAEIPLPTVSQIMGHKNMDSSKRYIALNDDMLRVCCLDISDYATTKEGLL